MIDVVTLTIANNCCSMFLKHICILSKSFVHKKISITVISSGALINNEYIIIVSDCSTINACVKAPSSTLSEISLTLPPVAIYSGCRPGII